MSVENVKSSDKGENKLRKTFFIQTEKERKIKQLFVFYDVKLYVNYFISVDKSYNII